MLNRWKEINNNALFAFDSMWNQPHWIVFAKRWCEESREAETAVEWVWPSNSGRVLEIVMSIMLIHLHCNITTCSATAWSNDEPVIRANHHLSSMCVCVFDKATNGWPRHPSPSSSAGSQRRAPDCSMIGQLLHFYHTRYSDFLLSGQKGRGAHEVCNCCYVRCVCVSLKTPHKW